MIDQYTNNLLKTLNLKVIDEDLRNTIIYQKNLLSNNFCNSNLINLNFINVYFDSGHFHKYSLKVIVQVQSKSECKLKLF